MGVGYVAWCCEYHRKRKQKQRKKIYMHDNRTTCSARPSLGTSLVRGTVKLDYYLVNWLSCTQEEYSINLAGSQGSRGFTKYCTGEGWTEAEWNRVPRTMGRGGGCSLVLPTLLLRVALASALGMPRSGLRSRGSFRLRLLAIPCSVHSPLCIIGT